MWLKDTFPKMPCANHWIQILTHLLYKSGNSNPRVVALQFWWVICLCCVGGKEDFTSTTWTKTWVRLSKTLKYTDQKVFGEKYLIWEAGTFSWCTLDLISLLSKRNNRDITKLYLTGTCFVHACTSPSSKTYFFKVNHPARTGIATFMKIRSRSLESDRALGVFTALLLS